MKTTPYITEEHIVAWLDGEIVGAEFDSALKQDATLAKASEEYGGLTRVFSASKADKRFALSAATNERVRAALEQEISTSRKTVRMPERASNAAPVRTAPAERVRKIWVRRSTIAIAFALLLGIFWFGTRSNTDNAPATATVTAPSQPSAPIVPAPSVTATEQPAATPAPVASNVSTPQPTDHHAVMQKQQTPDLTPQQVAETVAPPAQNTATPAQENDPAAVMASHRYAKLVKATPTVVISQLDKM